MAGEYIESVDIVFGALFALQIIFNVITFCKQLKRRVAVILMVNILLTVGLIFRLSMTVYQIRKHGYLLDKGEYYQYLYFEFPYHLFNVVAFIVLMQWIQLWAVLSEVNDISQNEINEVDQEQQNQVVQTLQNQAPLVTGGDQSLKGDQLNLTQSQLISPDMNQKRVGSNDGLKKKNGRCIRFQRFIRKKFFEGRTYYIILYGVVVLILSFLIIDTIFLSIDQAVREKSLMVIFEIFTDLLMIFGVIISVEYIIIYAALFFQFQKLDVDVRRRLSKNMTAFFIMMIILLGTRTLYYLFFRFVDFKYESDQNIDNTQLIFIYIEEIIFNFIVFYNLVLKEAHNNHFEGEYQKCKRMSTKKLFECEVEGDGVSLCGGGSGGADESLLTNSNERQHNKSREEISRVDSRMNMFHRKEQDEQNKGTNHKSGQILEFDQNENMEMRDGRTITEEDYDEEVDPSRKEQLSNQIYSDSHDSRREGGFRQYAAPLYSPGSLKRVTHSGFNMSMATSNDHQRKISGKEQSQQSSGVISQQNSQQLARALQSPKYQKQQDQNQKDKNSSQPLMNSSSGQSREEHRSSHTMEGVNQSRLQEEIEKSLKDLGQDEGFQDNSNSIKSPQKRPSSVQQQQYQQEQQSQNLVSPNQSSSFIIQTDNSRTDGVGTGNI